MLFATARQGALFLWMMVAGICIGVWYALLYFLRRFIQAGFYLTLACDLAFGAGAAAIWLAFSISGSYGQARLFELLAALLGALIFALASAAPLLRMESAFRRACRKIWTFLSENRLLKVIFK